MEIAERSWHLRTVQLDLISFIHCNVHSKSFSKCPRAAGAWLHSVSTVGGLPV